MAAFTRTIARLLLALPALLTAAPAAADDSPVERPAVEHPALPAGARAEPAPAPQPSTEHPAAPRPVGHARESGAPYRTATSRETRSFLYLEAGAGLLSGLGGGTDFQRSNPAITGAIGVELPLSRRTGLGFELNLDLELTGQQERGEYAAALLRARLSQLLGPRTRLWGAVGIGRAGYQSGTLAGAVAAGTALLFTRKFGVDLSANLNFVGAASNANPQATGIAAPYQGGLVLLVTARALFELHR